MPIVQCPRCRAELEVDAADLGHTVECPQCQSVFPAIAKSRERTDDDRRRRDPDDDYDFRRDRFSDDPRDRARDSMRAEEIVGRPARALMIASIIAAVLAGLISIGFIVAGISFINQPGGGPKGDPGILLIIYSVWFIFGTFYSGFIGFAAAKARDPRKNAWGYVAAIMGFTTFLFCHPINPYTWCAIGFGIWLLIAMNKPEVRRAVFWSKQPPARHRGSPLEDDDAPR